MHPDRPSPPRRGRPPADRARHGVAAHLLATTDALLREASHLELTERRIAAEAGVDEAMIRYYFGGKEGLLLDLTLRHCDSIEQQLTALEKINVGSPHPTERIITTLVEVYHGKPWIVRIMLAELIRKDSLIRTRFMERFGPVGPAGLVAAPVRRLVERLQRAGVYRPDVDAFDITINMISTIAAPLVIAPLSGDSAAKLRKYQSREWIAHLTRLFEAGLLYPPAAAAPKRKRRSASPQ